ncbi:Hypothetical protein MCYN_0102 [Mycoplasmopsis cynos C142]|uniref:Uncharacterized protein n=1 Tax=Mycoplasmopsis cynos (strain C142) TaxID=1246955 RepID=L0RUB0_MYCC1|nr:Hypothetical protein MCYN_0102 [Mycoplasmopsis cynos C142]
MLKSIKLIIVIIPINFAKVMEKEEIPINVFFLYESTSEITNNINIIAGPIKNKISITNLVL